MSAGANDKEKLDCVRTNLLDRFNNVANDHHGVLSPNNIQEPVEDDGNTSNKLIDAFRSKWNFDPLTCRPLKGCWIWQEVRPDSDTSQDQK